MTDPDRMAAISCLQINLNHSKLVQDCVAKKIKLMNKKATGFIICLQEPYIYGAKHARKPKSCNTYCNDNSPRAAIYLSMDITAWYIESLSTRDITVIQTKIKTRQTLVVSVYLDITIKEVIPDSLTAVMKYAKDKRLAILLCMDSNCHSSSFGTDDNKRGEVLDDFIAAHNLKIENKGTEYTFENTLASTIIDTTLSDKLAVSVQDWTVVRDENFTDHNDITFKLETDKVILEKTRKWENADWSLFKDSLATQQLQVRQLINEKKTRHDG